MERWITTLGQAIFRMPETFGSHRIPVGTLTLRVPVGPGGDHCRVSLSNRFGCEPVRLGAVELLSARIMEQGGLLPARGPDSALGRSPHPHHRFART